MVTAREVAREYRDWDNILKCRVTVKFYRFIPGFGPSPSPHYPRHHFVEVESMDGNHMRQFHWRPKSNLCWQDHTSAHERKVKVFEDIDPDRVASAICEVSDLLNIWTPTTDCNVWTERVVGRMTGSRVSYYK
eukprot:CAMPEP_0174890244 /NCGR_PEP_ID=MMETSP0167-20121228/5417_1 /TAXON_ID=38298 /ORGANISM="Rhodella maculata, Strain CCMP736" /LENGTH=132 /DNA_ID=CAMNT_0016127985 /DNA_START=151 /DNA_END=549 /DNA_ORIENTATION=-